jgi:hypothetical protein
MIVNFRFLIFFIAAAAFENALFSQNFGSDIQQAVVYDEAGDYSAARSQYENVLDRKLSSWQKAVLEYDIGTVFLNQGKWDEALVHYKNAQNEADIPVVLDYRLKSNRALARLMLANERMQALESNAEASDTEYTATIWLFRQVLDEINAANQAFCNLYRAEGGGGACRSSPEPDEMEIEAKTQIARLLQSYRSYRISHANLLEGIAALLSGAEGLLGSLSFFQEKTLPTDLVKSYLAMYSSAAESWRPLWEALEEKVHSSKNKEIASLFEGAQKGFFTSLSQMQRKDFSTSQASVEKSIENLNGLLHQILGENPLEALQRLLVSYGLVLVQDPIQETALLSLIKAQNDISNLAEKKLPQSALNDFTQAKNLLQAAEESLAAFKPIQTRMLVEMSQYYIKHLLQQIGPLAKLPDEVLENAIANGELALNLNVLREQAQAHEEISELTLTLLPKAQQNTLKAAAPFIASAIAKQRELFSAADGNRLRCQKSPWDEVIPLFVEGRNQAATAAQLLSQETIMPKSAAALQKKSLENWKDALAKLRSAQQQAKEQQAPTAKAAEAQQAQKIKPAEAAPQGDVIRLLQEMENDDRSKPEIKEAPANQREDRPW